MLLESSKIENVCVVGVQFDEIAEVPAAIVVRRKGAEITESEIFKMVQGKTDFLKADLHQDFHLTCSKNNSI